MKEVGFFNKVEIDSNPLESEKPGFGKKTGSLIQKTVDWYFDFGQASYKTINENYIGCHFVIKNEKKRSLIQIVLKVIECSIKVLTSPILIIPMLIGKIYFRHKNTFLIHPTATVENLKQKAEEKPKKNIDCPFTPLPRKQQTHGEPQPTEPQESVDRNKPIHHERNKTNKSEPRNRFINTTPFPNPLRSNFNVRENILNHPLIAKIRSAATPENRLEENLNRVLKDTLTNYSSNTVWGLRSDAHAAFGLLTLPYPESNRFFENPRALRTKGRPNAVPDPISNSNPDNLRRIVTEVNRIKQTFPNITSIPFYVSNSGNHATLVFVDLRKGTLEFYDSKFNYGNHDEINQTLTNLAREMGLTYQKKVNYPIQKDCNNCVFWSYYFVKRRLENPDFDPNTIENPSELIRQIRLEFILLTILGNIGSSYLNLRSVEDYPNLNKDIFQIFEDYILPEIAERREV